MKERKRTRLKGYDYSTAGYYFFTVCTQHRKHFFGQVKKGVLDLNPAGKSAEKWIHETINKFRIEIHEYIIMPNHFHAIIVLKPEFVPVGAGL